MSARVHAQVLTETGVRFSAPVSNLGSTGFFLETDEALTFGQRLSFRLFDVPVRGEVLFVVGAPRGVVIGMRAAPAALAMVEAHRDQVPVLEASVESLWSQAPTLSAVEAREPDTQEVVVADVQRELEAQGPLVSEPIDLPIDPNLFAAATIDDEFAPSPYADGPIDGPATAADNPVLGAVPDRHLSLVTDVAVSLGDERAFSMAPTDTGEDLPMLESDGYSVRFVSAASFQRQYETHLRHGGLVIGAGPLQVGTQRMLSLVVPNVGTYTVSARVIFHTHGKLGFVLDSFSRHRERLAAMAKAS